MSALSHVMLGASDVNRSASFYRDVLGLRMTARFEDFAFFDAGGITLALNGGLAVPGGAPAVCELVFAVPSVAKAHEELKDRIAFLNEPRAVNGENWAVNFRDLDGHMLSFYGPQ